LHPLSNAKRKEHSAKSINSELCALSSLLFSYLRISSS
jgi:hypothetical protein